MPAVALPPAPPSRHPSALALHEYQLAVLPAREAESVRRHLATCELCRTDLANLASDQRRFEREVFPQAREAIATNYCLNEIRGRKLRPAPVEQIPESYTPGSPDDPIADRELVQRLVHQVPEKLRTVAWLCHVDGLEQAEVAEILGVSRRTVVNRLAEFQERGRKVLARP